jgi:hypothetical protein
MDPLFKTLTVALVPQPRKMPLPPFEREKLQAIFQELSRRFEYQSFTYTPNGRGAIFQSAAEDAIELRPAEFNMQIKLDGPEPLVAKGAEDRATAILQLADEHLDVDTFLQCSLQIVSLAAVDGNDPNAKAFVSERLMKGNVQVERLGEGYFAGGVRFRRVDDQQQGAAADNAGEESLAIEPYLQDNSLVYLEHQLVRVAVQRPIAIDHVSEWIGDSFKFVTEQTMDLLANEGDTHEPN